MIATRVRSAGLLGLLLLVILLTTWLSPGAVWSQSGEEVGPNAAEADAPQPPDAADENAEPNGASQSEGQSEPEEEPQSGSIPRPVQIKDAEPWTTFQYVDEPFGWLVAQLESKLFYRVLSQERQYAQVNHVLYYYRDLDADPEAPFVIAERSKPRKPADMPDSVDPTQVANWVERGKVEPSADGKRNYRNGLLLLPTNTGKPREKQVEYIKYVIDSGAKYIRRQDPDGKVAFKPVTKLREALNDDPETWLTPEEIITRARAGELAVDFKENGEQTPHLFTEYTGGAPVVVIWLSGGAILFTLYFAFINFWGFPHALSIVSGVYDNPDEPGEVTHFQALASALSATVGLGNIAGVTIAMTDGGPGAFFWMILCGFFGMTSKFVECSLGQMYRQVKPDGTILGGPMRYLVHAFDQFGLKPVGVLFSTIFAVMCVMASFGGGNMFQANQATSQVLSQLQKEDFTQLRDIKTELSAAKQAGDKETLESLQQQETALEDKIESFEMTFKSSFGIVLAIFVGLVIIGGIKRIGATASKIVPTMCLMYIVACLWIIGMHFWDIPNLVSQIFTEAFNPQAVRGGILGVIVIGVQRAAFSNEAGVGSASIAHSAAKTEEPIREGFVALLGPFIDTIVVCSMTALVILITNAWDNRQWILQDELQGVELTSRAFGDEISWFPLVLTVAVVLFAFSTIISWSYYGERCWEQLFGPDSLIVYKLLFVGAVFIGAIFDLGNVLVFSDIMILTMAFPNILGCLLLLPSLNRELREYWGKYRAGEFKKYK